MNFNYNLLPKIWMNFTNIMQAKEARFNNTTRNRRSTQGLRAHPPFPAWPKCSCKRHLQTFAIWFKNSHDITEHLPGVQEAVPCLPVVCLFSQDLLQPSLHCQTPFKLRHTYQCLSQTPKWLRPFISFPSNLTMFPVFRP